MTNKNTTFENSKGAASDSYSNNKSEQAPEEPRRPKNEPSNQNIDDLPIPVSKPKTFEQLLEEEMAKGAAGGIVAENTMPSKQKQEGTAVPKKEFLRRKTQ